MILLEHKMNPKMVIPGGIIRGYGVAHLTKSADDVMLERLGASRPKEMDQDHFFVDYINVESIASIRPYLVADDNPILLTEPNMKDNMALVNGNIYFGNARIWTYAFLIMRSPLAGWVSKKAWRIRLFGPLVLTPLTKRVNAIYDGAVSMGLFTFKSDDK